MEQVLQLLHIKLSDIEPDPAQPRKDFNPIKLQELANSIMANGVIQAITVRPNPDPGKKYILVAGERRWRASKIAKKDTIIAIVKSDYQVKEERKRRSVQLSENLNREDLNPVEKAEFIQEMIELEKLSGTEKPIEKVCQELGVSPSWISKNTAILKYSEDVREIARTGQLRDYSLLRKVEKLPKDKKSEAISQIKKGDFNSKEFFARKRPERSEKTKTVIIEKHKLSFDNSGIIKLINKTDFKHILDVNCPEWQTAEQPQMKQFIKMFNEWINESD